MSGANLIALVCCDLGGIVRGRSVFELDLDEHLADGIGWVPANSSLTPHGPLAESTPFDSVGDLRLLPDAATRTRVKASENNDDADALDFVLCDIVETDGTPWAGCPRRFLRDALDEVAHELAGASVVASFEHEFQLLTGAAPPTPPSAAPVTQSSRAALSRSTLVPPAPPFSLEALRRAEPFPAEVMSALVAAKTQPERIFAEFAPCQFEIPVGAVQGIASADRAVALREVVREIARRHGRRATFTPLLNPAEAGNGVHIHMSLLNVDGAPLFYDPGRPGCLSELGGSFAAGILDHAGALNALTAPNPTSSARLRPHRWSAGAVCLAQSNREALLRIPTPVTLGGADPAGQLRLEYRGADASANPYLALGAIVKAGLDGVRAQLPAPPLLDRDPGKLDPTEADRYGVDALPASLEHALEALAADDTAHGWLPPLLYDAYVGVKRAEIAASAELDLAEMCARYAAIY